MWILKNSKDLLQKYTFTVTLFWKQYQIFGFLNPFYHSYSWETEIQIKEYCKTVFCFTKIELVASGMLALAMQTHTSFKATPKHHNVHWYRFRKDAWICNLEFCGRTVQQTIGIPMRSNYSSSLADFFYILVSSRVYTRFHTLRKHTYSNILKILPPKNENFQTKKSDIFQISAQNIDCGYSLEPPRWGGSNEYPQSMLLSRDKKNNVYPCKPQFYYIKVGFKGVKII